MNWKNLFSPVVSMNSTEARAYIDNHASGTYQLVDVRQPREYQQAHIPGAIFIPLAELPSRLKELNSGLPTIAYCAIGGRSRAASQLLSAQGFPEVYNLAGGIKAWEDRTATGDQHEGLNLLDPDADFADAVTLAYAMENGLQQFYRASAAATESEELKKLLTQLGDIEESHKERLLAGHEKDEIRETVKQGAVTLDDIMEGGFTITSFLHSVEQKTSTPHGILDLAMMLEAQALDLYGRMAEQSTVIQTREVFLQLADEEKAHLKRLAQELDTIFNG